MIFQVHGETRKPAAQLSKSLHRFYTGKIVSFFSIRYIAIDLSGGKKKLPIRSITVAPKNHIDLAREGMKEYLHSHGYEVDVELSRIKLRY